MRKVQIPLIYEAGTGNWLNICGLTYDDKENIIRADAWDGEGVRTYEAGEFVLDENGMNPLYEKSV